MIQIYPINRTFPGKPLKGKEKYAKLYHYTSFDTFIKIWLSKKLKFGDLKNVNDISEAKRTISARSLSQANLLKYVDKEIFTYKQISLTMDYDSYKKGCMSSFMWGHYGDKRRGICIELDFEKLGFENSMLYGQVQYKKFLKESYKIPLTLSNKEEVSKYVIKNKKEIFFTKLYDWKGENEFRIISKKNEYLDINDSITSIYIADYDSNECLLIEELVKSSVEVKEFHFSSSNGYKVPNIRNAKVFRDLVNQGRNDPNNALNQFS